MKYDVAIVGGGPAGTMAGCLLKRANKRLKVLVMDEGEYPFERSIGGFVNRKVFEAFPFLEDYKDKLVDFSPQSIKFISPDFSEEEVYEEDKPLMHLVHRSRFDNSMIEIAREMGVDLRFDTPAKEVKAGVDGAVLRSKRREKIESDTIIAADGFNSAVAREMRIYETMDQFSLYHSRSVMWSGRRQQPIQKNPVPLLSLGYNEILGYAFCWPLADSIFSGVFCIRRENLQPAFEKWIEQLIENKYLPKKARDLDANEYDCPAGVALNMERSYEKRTLLIGDAGGFVARTSGEGIYPGMLSAKVATDILLEGFEKNNIDDIIPTYSRAWNLEFGEYIQGAIQLNNNLSFLINMIFSDPKICARYARGFLFGENVI